MKSHATIPKGIAVWFFCFYKSRKGGAYQLDKDELYMKRALDIALLANGKTSPNPLVGALIVKDDTIIAEGWHKKAGLPHAERVALEKAGLNSKGSTMYVTLEPCSHFGKTPPCADALVKAGIKKVFVAMLDPNPLVAGKGVEKLRQSGIEVEVGLLEEKARKQNEVFLKWITEKMPFIVSKYAMSLDGKIATRTGDSKWISCDESRKYSHELRNNYDAIMVGINTVIKDDPSLTCRIEGGKNPIRIIVDSNLKIPLTANVICDGLAKTIVAVTDNADKKKIEELKEYHNVEVIVIPSADGRVDLEVLMEELAQKEITSILVEGGGILHSALLEENLVDKLCVFVAPKIISGDKAPSPVGGLGIDLISEAWQLCDFTLEKIGSDVLLSGYLCKENG